MHWVQVGDISHFFQPSSSEFMMSEQYIISWQTYYTGLTDWQIDFCNFLYYGLKPTKLKRILHGSSAQDINKTVGVTKTCCQSLKNCVSD